jgi:hypothetical protein
MLTNLNRNNLEVVAQGRNLPSVKEIFSIGITFSLTLIAWIFFRAESVSHAFSILSEIFSSSLFTKPSYMGMRRSAVILFFVMVLLVIEWFGREQPHPLKQFGFNWSRPVRWGYYLVIGLLIFFFRGEEQQFIYFQF